jgi:hypothetical protein
MIDLLVRVEICAGSTKYIYLYICSEESVTEELGGVTLLTYGIGESSLYNPNIYFHSLIYKGLRGETSCP